MKNYLLCVILFFCSIQQFYSQETQEGGVVVLNFPVRNSLKFNQYVVNPTFSFVRQQNKYISFSNKREWAQFDDAPQTYLFSYSGRFKENLGLGVGLFQQSYGVLTTFGGVLNYAYNVVLNNDNHLTFGINLGVYKSGLNDGKVVTNFPDSSLDNIPSNTIITVNPGINYGTDFFDFGISLNNIVSYNFETSQVIEENPGQSIQGHIMYTGYVNSRGFFDESKFSTLLKSEFKNDNTIFSGIAMIAVPKGIWAQAGYNSLYGISAGIGLNVTSQIALEYNYEKAIGDLASFGNSHDITLAYKFKNRYRYNYSGDDDESAFVIPEKKTKRTVAKQKSTTTTTTADRKAIAEAKAKVREEAIAKAKAKADERAKLVAQVKAERESRNKQLVQEKTEVKETVETGEELETKLEQEKQARLAAAKAEEEAQAKLAEAARIKAEAEAKAKAEEANRLRSEQEAQAKLAEAARKKAEAEAKAKAEEANRLRLEQEAQAKLEQEKQASLAAAKAEEEAQAKLAEVESESKLFIPEPTDAATRAMSNLVKSTEDSKMVQQELLERLRASVASREQDLKDLKEENDLSEQGIFNAPKAFKSVSAENAALESLKLEIDNAIKSQSIKIAELEKLYNERLKEVPNKNDSVNTSYLKMLQTLKAEQLQTIKTKENFMVTLEDIKVATEVERKRRIKRAAYDNEQDRYIKDRATLKQIQEHTPKSTEPLTVEDFNFGEELGSNIQIVKDVKNIESGYYLVLAVHSDVSKRDEFLRKAVSLGQTNINFFYDVNSSKYYIYYESFSDIEMAKEALQSKGDAPYNTRRSMIKIEN